MEILEIIKKARRDKHINQEKIAKTIGIATETYRDIENGKIRLKVDDYLKICEILELSPAIIASDDDSINLKLTKEDYLTIKSAIDVLNKLTTQANYLITDNSGEIAIGNNISIIKK